MPNPRSDENQRPTSDSRARSRSPTRKPKNFSGLKWKDSDRSREDRDYRRRDRRDDDRPRDHDRDSDRRDRPRDSDRRRSSRDRDSNRRRSSRDRERRPREDRKPRGDKEDKKPAATTTPTPTAAPSTGETMIMVTVNDRLGTKAQIPCLASDPVKLFKAMVAAKIGRPVHEIMLKRQGQRPFHDSLTLADYEISNGVQIDLELNTGD